MKLVREHIINEKFTEESDPIADLGIGGINLHQEIKSDFKELLDKWAHFLEDLVGKTITANFLKKSEALGIIESDKKFTIKVTEVEYDFDISLRRGENIDIGVTFFTGEEDQYGYKYEYVLNNLNQKIFIHE